jgi:hypothetical protein
VSTSRKVAEEADLVYSIRHEQISKNGAPQAPHQSQKAEGKSQAGGSKEIAIA